MRKYRWKNNRGQRTELLIPDLSNNLAHIHTYKSQHLIYDIIKKSIENANGSISIINFLITHPEIINLLIARRNNDHIPMRITTWLNQKQHMVIEEDKIYRLFKDQARSWRLLGLNSIPLRSYLYCHIKCFLFDKKTAIISSANVTKTSLLRNPENGILIHGLREEIDILTKFMRAVWDDFADYEINIRRIKNTSPRELSYHENYLYRFSRPVKFKPGPIINISNETENLRFLYSIPNYNTLYPFIINLLSKANEEILLISYKIEFWGKSDILKLLEEKIKKGVKVRILVCHKKTKILEHYSMLKEMGCEVMSVLNNHAKGIIVDQNEVLIMTSNLDRYILPGTNSINIGLYIKDSLLKEQAKLFLNHLFLNHDHYLYD